MSSPTVGKFEPRTAGWKALCSPPPPPLKEAAIVVCLFMTIRPFWPGKWSLEAWGRSSLTKGQAGSLRQNFHLGLLIFQIAASVWLHLSHSLRRVYLVLFLQNIVIMSSASWWQLSKTGWRQTKRVWDLFRPQSSWCQDTFGTCIITVILLVATNVLAT